MKSDQVEMSEQQKRARKSRNVAIGIALAVFVIILYVGTWAKFGANLFNRAL